MEWNLRRRGRNQGEVGDMMTIAVVIGLMLAVSVVLLVGRQLATVPVRRSVDPRRAGHR